MILIKSSADIIPLSAIVLIHSFKLIMLLMEAPIYPIIMDYVLIDI